MFMVVFGGEISVDEKGGVLFVFNKDYFVIVDNKGILNVIDELKKILLNEKEVGI